jgi:hypothetical protein
MRRFILLATALAGLWAVPVQAQMMQAIVADTHHAAGGGGYQGVGDVLSSAIAAYGLRAYSAAAATGTLQAIKVQSTAHSNETCDILLASTGSLGLTANCSGADNGISLSSFCTSNSDCIATKLYDQSGNARDVTAINNTTLSISPLKLLCNGSGYYTTAGNVTAAQPIAESSVAKRTSVTSYAVIVDIDDPNDSGFYNTSGNALIYAGTLTSVAYSEGTQVSMQAVFDGANSVMDINGSSTTGLNPGTGGGASKISICAATDGSSPVTGEWWESTIWQGTAANHTNFPFASMTSNQRSASNGWNF